MMKTRRPITDERGIAFPMAMFIMAILLALMAAFAVLATSEPGIASNHMASVQARSLAESGLERVLWALTTGESNPTANGVIVLGAGYALPSPVPAPYDGSTEVTLGVGSFMVKVTDGAQPNQKIVNAVGFVPNATNPVAIKRITAQVTRIKWIDPVCGLCAGGEQPPADTTVVKVGGSASVNASPFPRGNVPAGAFCTGLTPWWAVASTGTVQTNGTPNLYAPPGGAAQMNGAVYPQGMLLTDSDMMTLKAMAKANGTYYKGNPPWNGGLPADQQGNILNGLIVVDTTDGSVLTNSTPSANIPNVTIHSNGTWSGWLVVAGSIDISGNVTMNGLVYAQNDVTLHGQGNGVFSGAIISTNRVDTLSTNIDAEDIGNAPISYNCPAVRSGGGRLSQNWFIQPGTYRETPGSSL